jgi:hypothetical protein
VQLYTAAAALAGCSLLLTLLHLLLAAGSPH